MTAVRLQKGFTLIELIVVVAMLGVLAAVAIPSYQNMLSDARIAALSGVGGGLMSQGYLMEAAAIVKGCLITSTYFAADCQVGNGGYWPTAIQVTGPYGLNFPTNSIGKPPGLYLTPSTSNSTAVIAFYDAVPVENTGCLLTYTAGSSLISPPTIVYTTSAC